MASNNGNITKKQKLAPIQVFLRVRPRNKLDGNSAITYCTPKEIHCKGHSKGYTFDQIFDDKTSQAKLYKTVVSKMIGDVMKGYNCTVFAYGQTGTGKTYTILGGDTIEPVTDKFDWQEDSDAGIIVRATMQLYDELEKMDPNIQRTVTVSFMEIYNEEIRDLLCDKVPMLPLRIYEDKSKVVHVKDLQECTVLNPQEIFALLKKGCEKRQMASTLMNNRSSRSHTIFTITVSTVQTISLAGNLSKITCGKLNLIDLAGSENIAKSGSKEQRAREASSINQSLLTLGRVIKAFVENSSHVPYRESKLTRILQDSLGGKTKTSIVATISPGEASLDETLCTLDYAHNARNITNCPTINLRTSATAAAVQEELSRLKRDLFATANEQGVYMDRENYDEMTKNLTQFKKDILTKHEVIQSLTEQVENLTAQKEEWDNLRESFEKTRQAHQACQKEIELNRGKLQKDDLLLQYYENESTRFEETLSLMTKRDNQLRQKVEKLYATSCNNQNIMEKIIIVMEKMMDDLLTDGSENFSEITQNISTFKDFIDKVCHMLDNVRNQLLTQSNSSSVLPVQSGEYRRLFPSQELQLQSNSSEIQSNLESFIDNCDNRSESLNDKVEIINNLRSTILVKVVEKNNEIKNVLNRELLHENEYQCQEHEELHCLLEQEYENILIDKEDLLENEGELKDREQRLLEMKERNREMEQRIREMEQRIREMIEGHREMEEGQRVMEQHLREDRTRYKAKMEKMRLREERFLHLRKYENSKKDKAVSRYNEKCKLLEKNTEDTRKFEENVDNLLKNGIKQMVMNLIDEKEEEKCKMIEKFTQEKFEMASVLDQISDILNVQGKLKLDQVNMKNESNIEMVNNAAKNMKQNIRQICNSSLLPITRSGDTPSRLEPKPVHVRRSRDSLIRRLADETIDEIHSTNAEHPDVDSSMNNAGSSITAD